MTAEHVFYIPMVLATGVYLGWQWGRSALRAELAAREARQRKGDAPDAP
jgi:hypothetical protein